MMSSMKALVGGVVVILSALALFAYMQQTENTYMTFLTSTAVDSLQVIPISHASFILAWTDTVFSIDPTGGASAYAGKPFADLILLTDIHGDHLNIETLRAQHQTARIIAPQAVKDQLPEDLAARTIVLSNDETRTEGPFSITAVPMYNLPERDNAHFHTKGRGNGYLIEREGTRVYIAGDTADTPEMRSLTNISLAFIPMNLPYTMSVEDAANAVIAFKPKKVYPYHYRGPDGLSDIDAFKKLVTEADPSIEVVFAQWY